MTIGKRHRWVKVRRHVYVCRDCGTGRVKARDPEGRWFQTFHLPTWTSIVSRRVPVCAPGPQTPAVLRKHQSAIACTPVGREARV